MSDLQKEILDVLPIILSVFQSFGVQRPRITSGKERVEGRLDNSYHYQGLAVDFGRWIWTYDGQTEYIPEKKLIQIIKVSKSKIGSNYDFLLKKNHLHLEYDKRRAERNKR